MRFVTADEIQSARQIDAFSYLQAYCPGELVKLGGGEYCTKTHDSLKLSRGKWYWWSQGFGGVTALDYLVKVEKMDFVEAVQMLNNKASYIPQTTVSKAETERTLYVSPHNFECKTVREYLRKRCVSDEVIDFFIEKKMLAEENKTGYCLFFGNDEKGEHKQCSVRATDGKQLKREVSGSDKSYSFHYDSRSDRDSVRVFESAIDLMSFATLMDGAVWDFRKENMLSLSGVYMAQRDIEKSKLPAALKRYLEAHPNVKKVLLHLDNDAPGVLGAKGIMAALPKEYVAKFVPPPSEKDFNAYLCVKKTEENRNKKRSEERT